MNSDSKKILLVDDSDIDRTILKTILDAEGFQVEETDSGRYALSLISRRTPDAVFLDLSMPLMSGFDVLKSIEEMQADVPVFIITSESTELNVIHASRFRIAGFIAKPFDRDLLLARLNHVLGEVGDAAHTSRDADRAFIRDLKAAAHQLEISGHDLHYRRAADLAEIVMHCSKADGTNSDLFGAVCMLASKFDLKFYLLAHTEKDFDVVFNRLLKECGENLDALTLFFDYRKFLIAYYED